MTRNGKSRGSDSTNREWRDHQWSTTSFVSGVIAAARRPGLTQSLKLINDVVPIQVGPWVKNVLNLLDVGTSTVLLNVGIAPIQVLSNFSNALGDGDRRPAGTPSSRATRRTSSTPSSTAAAGLRLGRGEQPPRPELRSSSASCSTSARSSPMRWPPSRRCPSTAASIPDTRSRKTLTLTAVKAKARLHRRRGHQHDATRRGRSAAIPASSALLVGQGRLRPGRSSRRRHRRRRPHGRDRRDKHRWDDEDVDRHEVGLRRCRSSSTTGATSKGDTDHEG